jgi:hypothetical protein
MVLNYTRSALDEMRPTRALTDGPQMIDTAAAKLKHGGCVFKILKGE